MLNVDLELKWRIGETDGDSVDPVLFELLSGIRDGGSLRSAATAAGVSYRHAWGMMEHWEKLFGQPLATLSRGRGAELTELGQKLLWAQNRIWAKLEPELQSLASEVRTELDALLATDEPPALHVMASHGLALTTLKKLAAREHTVNLDLQFRGSLESLRQLKARGCDVAGFHIATGEIGEQLKPRFKPWLQPREQILIHVVTRSQGLMLAPGNPKNFQSIADIARDDVTMINRQPGSGTRLLFDQLLTNAAISPKQVRGYDSEEFTHLAVAALVASGSADAGFGIAAAAGEMQLDFLPLVSEHYYFCLSQSLLEKPSIKALLALLRSDAFRTEVNALSGYDASDAGDIVPIEMLLTRNS